jgi:hypothetical protein
MAFCRRTQYVLAPPEGSSVGTSSMTVYRSVPWKAWGTQISVNVDDGC